MNLTLRSANNLKENYMANPTEEQQKEPGYTTKTTEKGTYWTVDGINWYPLTEYYHDGENDD